jgi:hypothetical protein
MVAASSVMVAAAPVMSAAVMVASAASMVVAASSVMAATSVVMAAASVVVAAAVIVGPAVVVRAAAVAGVAPAIPAVASAPTIACAISISAPVPTGALPAVVVPAVIAAVEDELSLLERQQLVGRRHDECAVQYRRRGGACERRRGAESQRQAKSDFSRHGPDSLLLPHVGRRLAHSEASEAV